MYRTESHRPNPTNRTLLNQTLPRRAPIRPNPDHPPTHQQIRSSTTNKAIHPPVKNFPHTHQLTHSPTLPIYRTIPPPPPPPTPGARLPSGTSSPGSFERRAPRQLPAPPHRLPRLPPLRLSRPALARRWHPSHLEHRRSFPRRPLGVRREWGMGAGVEGEEEGGVGEGGGGCFFEQDR